MDKLEVYSKIYKLIFIIEAFTIFVNNPIPLTIDSFKKMNLKQTINQFEGHFISSLIYIEEIFSFIIGDNFGVITIFEYIKNISLFKSMESSSEIKSICYLNNGKDCLYINKDGEFKSLSINPPYELEIIEKFDNSDIFDILNINDVGNIFLISRKSFTKFNIPNRNVIKVFNLDDSFGDKEITKAMIFSNNKKSYLFVTLDNASIIIFDTNSFEILNTYDAGIKVIDFYIQNSEENNSFTIVILNGNEATSNVLFINYDIDGNEYKQNHNIILPFKSIQLENIYNKQELIVLSDNEGFYNIDSKVDNTSIFKKSSSFQDYKKILYLHDGSMIIAINNNGVIEIWIN